ncbi:hypothetical protein [Lentzea sp. NPDC059081]|uniref:hypothetical protein n=1 Tax=Lentzea sp. NPDC059081 TaxID=3346719 RepID=UPI00367B69C7
MRSSLLTDSAAAPDTATSTPATVISRQPGLSSRYESLKVTSTSPLTASGALYSQVSRIVGRPASPGGRTTSASRTSNRSCRSSAMASNDFARSAHRLRASTSSRSCSVGISALSTTDRSSIRSGNIRRPS